MSPIRDPHVRAINHLNEFMVVRLAGGEVTVSIQNPIRLSDDTEPQPDLAVLRGRGRGVANAADVLLVIEVADTSRRYDRNVKLPLYAAAEIPEAWLVDLVARTIERHTEPHNGRYRQITIAGCGESLASTVLPAIILPVDAVVG
jgi:Uma2 family endonuclease